MSTPTVTITAVCGWCEAQEDYKAQIGCYASLPRGWEERESTMVCVTEGDAGYHRMKTLILCPSCNEKAAFANIRASKLSETVRKAKHNEVWSYMADLMESSKEGNLVACDPSKHSWPCTFCKKDAEHKIDQGYSGNPIVCTNCGFRTYKKLDSELLRERLVSND